MIIIEVSLYCCDKLANFGTNTHKPELYLLSFGCFLFSLAFKKSSQMTINITQACVYLCQNLLIYHNNTMKPQLQSSVIARI